MANFKDRRVIIGAGMALALGAGLLLAVILASRHGPAGAAPPASQGGLVVQTGRDDDIKLDPQRPLRCFVGGQLVGELVLSECARRNGVATGALDVGLDQSGALAAAHGDSSQITPLPPTPDVVQPEAPAAASDEVAEPTPVQTGRLAGCWRYSEATWGRLAGDMPLAECVSTLYDGQCVRLGGALYGRWGGSTLRLRPGRVEISADNRNFRTLVEQGPACSIPSPPP